MASPPDDPNGSPEPPAPYDPATIEEVDDEDVYLVDSHGQPSISIRQFAASYFRGPLPSPETLRQYSEAIPGLGERIISNWEEEGRHRRAMERRLVDAGITNQSRGQLIAGFLATIVSLGGIVLLATGHSVEGLIALLPGLAGLIGVFVYRSVGGR